MFFLTALTGGAIFKFDNFELKPKLFNSGLIVIGIVLLTFIIITVIILTSQNKPC